MKELNELNEVRKQINELNSKADHLLNRLKEKSGHSSKVALSSKIEDNRGFIQNLVFDNFSSAAIITSKKGTDRSSHFHKEGWHYLYVISGEMEYFEHPVGNKSTKKIIVKAGEMVFTGPMLAHKTVFTQDTVLLSLTSNHSKEEHQSDTIKVDPNGF